jgi:hypothetical protein
LPNVGRKRGFAYIVAVDNLFVRLVGRNRDAVQAPALLRKAISLQKEQGMHALMGLVSFLLVSGVSPARPVAPAESCSFDSQCSFDQHCDNGSCVMDECEFDSECPGSNWFCLHGECVEKGTGAQCFVSTDCPIGDRCVMGVCTR